MQQEDQNSLISDTQRWASIAVLRVIYYSDEAISLEALSQKVSLTQEQLANSLDKLESDGLISQRQFDSKWQFNNRPGTVLQIESLVAEYEREFIRMRMEASDFKAAQKLRAVDELADLIQTARLHYRA